MKGVTPTTIRSKRVPVARRKRGGVEVLEWFAEETDVFYGVEHLDRLLVLFQNAARRDDDSQPGIR